MALGSADCSLFPEWFPHPSNVSCTTAQPQMQGTPNGKASRVQLACGHLQQVAAQRGVDCCGVALRQAAGQAQRQRAHRARLVVQRHKQGAQEVGLGIQWGEGRVVSMGNAQASSTACTSAPSMDLR